MCGVCGWYVHTCMCVHRGETKNLSVLLYRSPPDSFETVFFFFDQTWSLSGGQQALAICLPPFALRSVQVTRMFSHTRLCPWVLRISAYILTLIEQTFLPLEPSTLIWYYLLIFKTSENTIK